MAQSAAEAHGKQFVARPATKAVIKTCGSCHEKSAKNYLRSAHYLAKNKSRRPDCITCHRSHGTPNASIKLISEPLCSSCHPVSQARRIFKALHDADHELDKSETRLKKVRNGEGYRENIRVARAQLHGITHAMNLFEITREAALAIATADQVKALALPPPVSEGTRKGILATGIATGGLILGLGCFLVISSLWRFRKKIPLFQIRPKRWMIIAAAIIAIAGVAGAWKGHNFVQHDPKFCTSCHTMDSAYNLWQESGHKNVECHTCHETDLSDNLHQVWFYLTKKPDEVLKHAFVDRHICEKCHASGENISKWNRIVETPGHRIHAGKEKVECIQCHALSVHRFKPGEELCKGCHEDIALMNTGGMGEMHCLQCHPFLAQDSKRSLRPDRTACLDCHESMQVRGEAFSQDAPMSWACGECHKPHSKIRITKPDCVACHDLAKTRTHKIHASEDCLSCHKPHTWKVSNREICTSCHADKK